MVAQEITLQAPDLVRKLILVGTGPRGGEGRLLYAFRYPVNASIAFDTYRLSSRM